MYILLYNQLEAKIKSSIFGTPITLRYEQILHWWIEEYVWNWLTKSLSSTVEFLGRNWELKSWWRILFQFFGQQKKLYLFIMVFNERNCIVILLKKDPAKCGLQRKFLTWKQQSSLSNMKTGQSTILGFECNRRTTFISNTLYC